ncbi:hypothetical protein ACFONL_01305 [Camelimonas fluminis]|uniref:Uncharacterized protein n=1 Tax=Camelimonas fluminis TaxID=1576911 RepID=A0ABV7UCF7_9HYPH
MTEIQIGDRVSIELVVTKAADIIEARLPFRDGVSDLAWEGISAHRTFFTLVRRAPVDLWSVEIPKDGLPVIRRNGDTAIMLARNGDFAWLEDQDGCMDTAEVSTLRPLDAPAPESEVERLRGALTLVASSGKFQCFDDAAWDVVNDALASTAPTGSMREAIAKHHATPSDAPTCPPGHMTGWFAQLTPEQKEAALAYRGPENHGPICPPCHIMIGDRAVPEPMRVEPKTEDWYWAIDLSEASLVVRCKWLDDTVDSAFFRNNAIHSTEANARAHAEAIIALSAGEGV